MRAGFPICEAVKAALMLDDKSMWIEAINSELDSLHSFECWTMTGLPPRKRTIGSRIILNRRRNDTYKAFYMSV